VTKVDVEQRRRAHDARARAVELQESALALQSQARQILRRIAERRRVLRFEQRLSDAELLDLGTDVERLLGRLDELDLSPAARDLLFALDDLVNATLH
jgi:hypothetical protein